LRTRFWTGAGRSARTAEGKSTEGEAHIHHDRIVEKLEIARTMGLLTDFSVDPSCGLGVANVTVWPSANADEESLKSHLARLLDGLVAEPAIIVEPPAAAVAAMPEAISPPDTLSAANSNLPSARSRRKALLHGVATAGAMLTCVGILLNVGPFAGAPKLDGVPPSATQAIAAAIDEPRERQVAPEQPAAPERPRESRSIAWQDVDARAPFDRPQTAAELPDVSEATRTMLQLASFMPADTAPAAVPPVRQQDSDADAKLAVNAAGAAVLAAPPQGDQASADIVKGDPIVGVWAPDAGTCSARNFREGTLPTVMNTDGAWAGDTFCMFTHQQPTENGWKVVAKCSNPRERWTSNVRLTVTGNRLTWTSRRGTQAYTRCAPDVLMAQAR
jgi:hypothetical protein